MVLAACCAAGCENPSREGAFTLAVDNDSLVGSDNGYTNGLGLTWTSPEVKDCDAGWFVQDWVDGWEFLPGVNQSGRETWASWTLSQEMHTPDDITIPDPPLDDRPYAGVLALDSAIHSRRDGGSQTWNLRVGMVGPSSQADRMHEEFHSVVGGEDPKGWEHQLPDEPILNVDYARASVLAGGNLGDSASWRLVQHGSLSAGTYFTGGGLGTVAELGWNLPDDLGSLSPWTNLNAARTITSPPLEPTSFSVFAGLGGFAVAHYLPLDGTVFHSSRSVNSDPLVGLARTGMSLRRGAYIVSLSWTWFTETFEHQQDRSSYGSFSVSWFF